MRLDGGGARLGRWPVRLLADMRLRHFHSEHIYHETRPADLHSNRCVRALCAGAGVVLQRRPAQDGLARVVRGDLAMRAVVSGRGEPVREHHQRRIGRPQVGRPSIDQDGQTF